MEKPTIYLATDHAGLELKNLVRDWLMHEGYEVQDCGAHILDIDDDFPDYIRVAAAAIAEKPTTRKAILFGGSGQGEAMQANRFKGVRAAVYYGGADEVVPLSRQHNDTNVLSIGARFVSENKAKEMIWLWLHTEPNQDKKYHRRNVKLDRIEVKDNGEVE